MSEVKRASKKKYTPERREQNQGGGPPHTRIVQKPKNFKGTMKKLMESLRPYYPVICIVIVFGIVSTVFAIVGPKILGEATTAVYTGVSSKASGRGIDFDFIKEKLVLLLVLYVISALFSVVQQFIMAGVSQKISYTFRKQLSQKINRLPMSFFDKTTQGEVLSRVTNDVATLSQSLSQSLTMLISSMLTIVGVLVMMVSINIWMTLVALLIIPLTLGLVTLIVKQSQKHFKKQQEYLGHLNGQIEEVYGAHIVVKAFNAEEGAMEEFKENNSTLYNSAWKAQFLSGVMMPATSFVGNLGYVAVCLLGGLLAIRKAIQIGDILSFIQYVRQFTMPLTQTAQVANVLQSTAAAAERVFEFLSEQEESPDTQAPKSTADIVGSVRFNNVCFGYNEDKIVIKDFSADIKAGQRIAIVGHTGAGKTTIVKLLMRFYELNGGSIEIDGIKTTDFTRNDLRKLIGMVLQDAWLFNGTIMENIRYGRLNATDEEVKNAAIAAHADHFIKTLSGTYNMELNEEGTNISLGQKQLLTIARAILSDPRILILDEATSSVDTRTEVLIQKAMSNLMEGRTSFIIAHRLSTIRNADLILVLENGDIVEQGTHKELLSRKGFYSKLYMAQFENAENAG